MKRNDASTSGRDVASGYPSMDNPTRGRAEAPRGSIRDKRPPAAPADDNIGIDRAGLERARRPLVTGLIAPAVGWAR